MVNSFKEIPRHDLLHLQGFAVKTKDYLIFRIDGLYYSSNHIGLGITHSMKKMSELNDYVYVNPSYAKSANYINNHSVAVDHPYVGRYNFKIEDLHLMNSEFTKEAALLFNYKVKPHYSSNFFEEVSEDSSSKKNEFIKSFENFDKVPELKDIKSENFSQPKQELANKLTFVEKGCFRCEEFLPYSAGVYSEDSIPLKDDTEDVRLFLPVQWVSYAGYNEAFVSEWVNHLRTILCVDIKYLGIKEFTSFEPMVNYQRKNLLTKNEFYCIQIPGDELKIHKYFLFSLLRGLYHTYYNNVPGLTIQIMTLEKVSFIKAYLLALLSVDLEGKHFIRCGIFDNKNTAPYVTDYTDISERLIKYKKLNCFDVCMITADNFIKLREYLASKDFDKAFDFFKDIKSEPVKPPEDKYKNGMMDNPFLKKGYKGATFSSGNEDEVASMVYKSCYNLLKPGVTNEKLNIVAKSLIRPTFIALMQQFNQEGLISYSEYVDIIGANRIYKGEGVPPKVILGKNGRLEIQEEPPEMEQGWIILEEKPYEEINELEKQLEEKPELIQLKPQDYVFTYKTIRLGSKK